MPSKHILRQLEKLPLAQQHAIQYAADTMAIENMPLTDHAWQDLIDLASGRKTSEQIQKELEREYGHG